MVGLVKPEVDRHMNKIFQKLKKKIESIKLRHLQSIPFMSMIILLTKCVHHM